MKDGFPFGNIHMGVDIPSVEDHGPTWWGVRPTRKPSAGGEFESCLEFPHPKCIGRTEGGKGLVSQPKVTLVQELLVGPVSQLSFSLCAFLLLPEEVLLGILLIAQNSISKSAHWIIQSVTLC